jgi:NADPH-dependent 7-cyano-7-deazaguanine reductase QueF
MPPDTHRARRATLAVAPNPGGRLDYLVELALPWGEGTLTLRYVPDRLIVTAESLAAYGQALAADGWSSPEGVVVTALDDLANELVPRWLHITLSVPAGAVAHAVVAEERQPGWNNTGLLARLKPM